jgi:hypothetical protein
MDEQVLLIALENEPKVPTIDVEDSSKIRVMVIDAHDCMLQI